MCLCSGSFLNNDHAGWSSILVTGKPKASLSCFATVDLPAPLCPLIKITLDGSVSAHLTKYKSSLACLLIPAVLLKNPLSVPSMLKSFCLCSGAISFMASSSSLTRCSGAIAEYMGRVPKSCSAARLGTVPVKPLSVTESLNRSAMFCLNVASSCIAESDGSYILDMRYAK